MNKVRCRVLETRKLTNMKMEWIENYMDEAVSLINNQNLQEGLALLNSLLYEEPGYGRLHNHLGWAYCYHTPETKLAELHLKMAAKFDPEYAPSYLHLGNLYQRMERYPEALLAYETSMRKPMANRPALLEEMAKVYELQRNYRMAIATYKKALLSTLGAENQMLNESIRRCRKKRLTLLFTF